MGTAPHVGTQRVLVGSVAPTLRAELLDQDGEPVSAGASPVTADIYRADGTVVALARVGVGTLSALTVALTNAEAAVLDMFRVEWSVGGVDRLTTYHQTVGGFLFQAAELATRPGMAGYSAERRRDARDWITDIIEENTGVSWCRAYAYEAEYRRWDGRCRFATRKRPLHVVRSLTVDGAAQDLSSIAIDSDAGIVHLDHGLETGLVAVGYEHGFSAPTADLKEAALVAAADWLTRGTNGLSDRTRSTTIDIGLVQTFSYAGKDHPTGIDSVDAVIMAHDHRIGGFLGG